MVLEAKGYSVQISSSFGGRQDVWGKRKFELSRVWPIGHTVLSSCSSMLALEAMVLMLPGGQKISASRM